jgi:hypothetical protein
VTIASRPARTALLAVTVLVLAALAAAACSVANEDVEADEFFRPAAPPVVASDVEDPPDADAQSAGQAAEQAAGDDAADEETTEDDAPEQSAPEQSAGADDTPADTTTDDDDADLEIAEDIVRRYRSPSYGYSLDLVCGPFCDINAGGIDLVIFRSETDPTAINVTAHAAEDGATLDDLETVWHAETIGDREPEILARQEVTLASDSATPALIIDWAVDRRATGGVIERWRSLITRVGPIAYFVNAGAIDDAFADLEPVLQQTLDSFLAVPVPDSLPGEYTRFGFGLSYDTSGFVGELPLAGVANQPTADGGRFFHQDADGILRYILTWESLSQAIYNADAAIDADSQPPGAVSSVEESRDDFQLTEAISGRVGAFTATDAAGNDVPVRVFSWYCEEGGRSFTLQSISEEERPAVLDGFRCVEPD